MAAFIVIIATVLAVAFGLAAWPAALVTGPFAGIGLVGSTSCAGSAITAGTPYSRCSRRLTSAGFPGRDQTGLVGQHDGLRAITKAKLPEDPGDVGLHGGLLDEERP